MKPRIIFLIDTLQSGGAEHSLLQIASCFHHFEPVFVQLYDKNNDLMPAFEAAGIRVIQLHLPDTFRFGKLARVIAEKLRVENPVLLHATLFKSDMFSRELVRYIPVPLINSFVNNSYSKERYGKEPLSIKIKLWFIQQWDAFTAHKVSLFLANSETIKITNAKALRLSLKKIKVIYRGRSSTPYDTITETQREDFRNEMNVNDRKIFLNVSRLIERKGQRDLLHAFASLLANHPQCTLWIAGEGPLRNTLESEIRMLNLQDKVFLLGNRNDIPMLLKSADYFVFPSYYEGLPGAIIEAMFAKIPIIASDIPENKECVNESMALFHEAGNKNDLASQMNNALYVEDWHERTQRALEYASIHFDITKVAEQYEQLYDELFGG